jgi:PiT family inorganic phosphate transporter
MTTTLLLALLVVIVALFFELINGFHDAANSIATVTATKVLTPNEGIVIAAVFELIGAFCGTAVAATIATGLVKPEYVTLNTVLAGLIGGIIWNLLTWWFGLPSSSSHALMGGLCGAGVASAGGNLSVINFGTIQHKVILPMIVSPCVGFFCAFLVMGVLLVALRGWKPRTVNVTFGRAQIISAAGMALSHGMNDAQKTMGIIALALAIGTKMHAFDNVPRVFSFLSTTMDDHGDFHIASWIKVVCALTMASGTAMGGRRIIKTLGKKMVKMQPIHGFAAQTTAAGVIIANSHFGMPISTTHVITTSIMGVGATKRLNAVKWSVVGRILIAWVCTLPISAAMSYGIMLLFKMLGAH